MALRKVERSDVNSIISDLEKVLERISNLAADPPNDIKVSMAEVKLRETIAKLEEVKSSFVRDTRNIGM